MHQPAAAVPEISARLLLKDGRQLFIRDSAGFSDDNPLGPLMDAPPLTRDQLRTLALRPEQLQLPHGS